MNEFTKEELQYLHETLRWITEDFKEPDSTYELRDKIQSLIDNYCEHEHDKEEFLRCLKCSNENCNKILGVLA